MASCEEALSGDGLSFCILLSLTYYLENGLGTSMFAANQLFSSFAGVQAHDKFIKNADDK
jgi:hypothetical protein